MIHNSFLRLCGILCRTFDTVGANLDSRLTATNRILRHIDSNLHRRLNLTDLAAYANISVPTLLRVFRQMLDTSPMEYINRLRMERAAEELRQTNESITSIALQYGFSDGNYFSMKFSRAFHMAPREYRKQF